MAKLLLVRVGWASLLLGAAEHLPARLQKALHKKDQHTHLLPALDQRAQFTRIWGDPDFPFWTKSMVSSTMKPQFNRGEPPTTWLPPKPTCRFSLQPRTLPTPSPPNGQMSKEREAFVTLWGFSSACILITILFARTISGQLGNEECN